MNPLPERSATDGRAGTLFLSAFVLAAALCLAGIPGRSQARTPDRPMPLPDFASLASREEAVVVSIVAISATGRTGAEDREDPFLDDDRDPAVVAPRRWRPKRNLASGIVVSPAGQILTSAHAVTGADEVSVRLADGREFRARIVGLDPRSDVAVIEIEATGLAVASIGNPHELAVGDWVVAIGAPFGFESSVTAGIVSARRFLPGGAGVPFIQSDVAVNPGSSGGPLFNLRGEVVAMNSMAYTSNGGYMGVSFAMPIDAAMDVSRQILAQGHVVRGQIGAQVQEVTLALARAFGRAPASGALVVRVIGGGPAARAGLRAGDIVVGVDGRAELSYAQVQQRVVSSAPGSELALDVWRDGSLRRLKVEVAELAPASVPIASTTPDLGERGDRLGLVVQGIPSAPASLAESEGGVEVRASYSLALRGGIGAGDVILALNGTPTLRLGDYQAALSRLAPGAHAALLVRRDGVLAYVALGAVP